MRPNATNSSRAARKLQRLTDLTYQQALERIRVYGEIPDLESPEAVTAFLAKTAPVVTGELERYYVVLLYSGKSASTAIWTRDQLQPEMLAAVEADPDAQSWAGIAWGLGRVREPIMSPVIYPEERYDVVINDEIGFTTDNWGIEDLRPDMLKAILADPGAGRWEHSDEDGTWDITSEEIGAIVLDLTSVDPSVDPATPDAPALDPMGYGTCQTCHRHAYLFNNGSAGWQCGDGECRTDPPIGGWPWTTSATSPVTAPTTPTGDDVLWANADGEFPLAGGGWGNPGCDCGMDDAVIKVNGEYLCANEAATRGYVWMCDECENPIVSPEAISDQHASWCSLYTKNLVASSLDEAIADRDRQRTEQALAYPDGAPEPVRVRVEMSDGSVEQYRLERDDPAPF